MKEQRDHLTDLAIAIHEAGHAVAAIALRAPGLRDATIDSEIDGYVGHCTIDRGARVTWGPRLKRHPLNDGIVVKLAGNVAGRRGAAIHCYPLWPSEPDEENAFGIAMDISIISIGGDHEANARKVLDRLRKRTERVVERYYPHIEAVAWALIEQRTMQAAEIRRVFNRIAEIEKSGWEPPFRYEAFPEVGQQPA